MAIIRIRAGWRFIETFNLESSLAFADGYRLVYGHTGRHGLATVNPRFVNGDSREGDRHAEKDVDIVISQDIICLRGRRYEGPMGDGRPSVSNGVERRGSQPGTPDVLHVIEERPARTLRAFAFCSPAGRSMVALS